MPQLWREDGRRCGRMALTAEQKRKAIKLAYIIVTDRRNSDRYAFAAITNPKTFKSFGYNEMVETLEAMYREADGGET